MNAAEAMPDDEAPPSMELLLYLAEFQATQSSNEHELGDDPLEVERMMHSDATESANDAPVSPAPKGKISTRQEPDETPDVP